MINESKDPITVDSVVGNYVYQDKKSFTNKT